MDFFEGFLTWEILGSPYGLIFMTCLLVHFTKDLIDKIPRLKVLGTFKYGVFIAFALRIIFLVGISDITYQSIVLAFLNGFIVELVAGTVIFDQVIKRLQNKFNINIEAEM